MPTLDIKINHLFSYSRFYNLHKWKQKENYFLLCKNYKRPIILSGVFYNWVNRGIKIVQLDPYRIKNFVLFFLKKSLDLITLYSIWRNRENLFYILCPFYKICSYRFRQAILPGFTTRVWESWNSRQVGLYLKGRMFGVFFKK